MGAPRVLVVDDDTQVLGMLMRVLIGRGYTVTGSTSGADVLEAAAESRFDLAIVDLSMPDIDGFQVLKDLHRTAPEMKIMAITGAMPGLLLDSAAMFGATKTLTKPISPESLITAVQQVLERRVREAHS
jgi:two-component system cell cycle sensor histidine kinase/response regulator CckA